MKVNLLIFLIAFVNISTLTSQVTPNTKRFQVKNYITIDNSGNYHPYSAHGFVETVGDGSRARLFLMPFLKVDMENITYIDSQGFETFGSGSDVFSVQIPVRLELSLPNDAQKGAIGAAISGANNNPYYFPPLVVNNLGRPAVVSNNFASAFQNQIMQAATNYAQTVRNQQKYIDAYNKCDPEIITLNEFEIIVKVGNATVYDERFSGTLVSVPDIAIDNPSEYIKNSILAGNFSILVKYKFRDSFGSYINARIDAKAIVDQFLNEAQNSVVNQRSKGWSFLGFGNRRKSLKSKFDEQVAIQYKKENTANTTIEMYDADDNMIKFFEDAFFPVISKQNAIDNHLAAAQQSGNEQLSKLHFDYASSLQNNDPNLEVDIGKATAALAKKDYVGFIANGVRWGDYKANGNNSFRRVVNTNEMQQLLSEWSQTKRVSVSRVVTQQAEITENIKLKSMLGTVKVFPFAAQLMMTDGSWSQMQNVRGVVLGPITFGTPYQRNNILAGNLVTRIDGNNVYDLQSYTKALNQYSPGQNVTVTIVDQYPNQNFYKERKVQMQMGGYPSND